MRQRRFTNSRGHAKAPIWVLPNDHSAIIEGKPLFPKTTPVSQSPRLFVSGFNSRKLGGRVTKGEWAGMPIYQLTLPERTTCPSHCHAWNSCYGNAMPFARRHEHGKQLEERIPIEIDALSGRHTGGFVVRLHVLGDFYSARYAALWMQLLFLHPQLHIFGYTARDKEHDPLIFKVIEVMNRQYPERCSIRYSRKEPGPMHAVIIKSKEEVLPYTIACPAQTEKSECCGTCGLCWSPAAKQKTIAFIEHGPTRSRS